MANKLGVVPTVRVKSRKSDYAVTKPSSKP